VWKETVVFYFKALSQHLVLRNAENHGKISKQPNCGFDPGPSKYAAAVVTTSAVE